MEEDPKRYYPAILLGIAASAVIGLLVLGRIPQDPADPLFAGTQTIARVSNLWDPCSNLPFLLIGLSGPVLPGARRCGRGQG